MLDRKIFERCGFCNEDLFVPESIDKKVREAKKTAPEFRDPAQDPLKKQYDGFYVSGYGHYYCNSECHNLFTES